MTLTTLSIRFRHSKLFVKMAAQKAPRTLAAALGVMRRMMRRIFTVCFATLLYYTGIAHSSDIDLPFIVENACPFEGCKFGEWRVLGNIQVHKEPDLSSPVVENLKSGTKVKVSTGIELVYPGRAKVIGKPYSHEKLIDRQKEILILNYIGEGRSKVFHNGHYFTTKISRKHTRCSEKPNWRYCWIELLEEPTSIWWVKIEGLGWVIVKNKTLEPIDAFS